MSQVRDHWTKGLFPPLLMDKDGKEKATAAAFQGKRAIGVLFSAHWCGLCRAFAPLLKDFYHACRKKDEDALEIVFVSSDRNGDAFRSYLDTMPWLAVPYHETSVTAKLAGLCRVRRIPALIIFDGDTGEVLNNAARDDISARGSMDEPLAVVESWLRSHDGGGTAANGSGEVVRWAFVCLLLVLSAAVVVYLKIR